MKNKITKNKSIKTNLFSIISIILCGFNCYFIYAEVKNKKHQQDQQNRIHVLSDHFQLLNHWLELKNEGKNLVTYFEDMGYHHIAIYGMSELANRLCEELEGSSVRVDYGIDRDIACTIGRMDTVYFPEDDLPETDVIVVTPYSSFDVIKGILEKKVNCPIVSLEDVVWSV